jgi:hypothetical protein
VIANAATVPSTATMAPAAELIRAILAVADGQAAYGAPIARRIAELFGPETQATRPPPPSRPATPAYRVYWVGVVV